MASIPNDEPVARTRRTTETGETEAFYGAGIGALVGLVIGLFTSAGVVPAMFAMGLYGLMISGGVSLVATLREHGRAGRPV